MRNRLLIALLLLCVLSSCGIMERKYMPGYYLDRPSKKSMERPVEARTDQQQEDQLIIQPEETASIEKPTPYIPTVTQSPIVVPKPTATSSIKEESEESVAPQPMRHKKDNKVATQPEEDSGNKALRIIGWVVLVIGLIILLIVSILIGIILMLLGLVFIIVGRKKKGGDIFSEKKEEPKQYQDVVYLKNGSVIRGMIIEQIPNVSIKVQTKDKSIFVYKMDEVEKITKELEP